MTTEQKIELLKILSNLLMCKIDEKLKQTIEEKINEVIKSL